MRPECHPPIALFDSGVGGLTVYKAISALLPEESLIYLGDTARLPYGTKSADTIVRYTLMAAGALARQGAKMIVIACNTATAAALPTLREKFAPIPVLGVVEPGAHAAVEASASGHIAVIATEATVNGGAYQKAIRSIRPDARVTATACTLFVPLAEEGWTDGIVAEETARRYLKDIFKDENARPDTLLLGCTHFPLLRGVLGKVVPPGTRIVDSAEATAKWVLDELDRRGLRASGGKPTRRLLTTDNRARFARTGGFFLGQTLCEDEIEIVDI